VVVGPYEDRVVDLSVATHGKHSRVVVGWVDGEIAKWAYSDDNGATWSPTFILGTYTGLDLIDLPSGHLMAIVEHHHRLWGLISRDRAVSWDDPFPIPSPEAAIEPHLLLDIYNDTVVFSSEWDTSVWGAHTYKIQLRDLPFFAFVGEVLDLSGVAFFSSSFSSSSSSI